MPVYRIPQEFPDSSSLVRNVRNNSEYLVLSLELVSEEKLRLKSFKQSQSCTETRKHPQNPTEKLHRKVLRRNGWKELQGADK